MADVSEISLIRFGVINFWALVMQRPFIPPICVLCGLVKSIILAEKKIDKEKLDKIEYIMKKTNPKLSCSINYVEQAVFRNLNKGINSEITIGDNDYTFGELSGIIDDIRTELIKMVTEIVKEYTFDLPFSLGSSGDTKIGFGLGSEISDMIQKENEKI